MFKYKISAYVRGKLKTTTVEAKNKDDAKNKAAKHWGKAADVGYFAITRIKK